MTKIRKVGDIVQLSNGYTAKILHKEKNGSFFCQWKEQCGVDEKGFPIYKTNSCHFFECHFTN